MNHVKLLLIGVMLLIVIPTLCGCYGKFQPKYESMGIVITPDTHTGDTNNVFAWLENTSDIPLRVKMIKLEENLSIKHTKWITVFIPGEKRHIFLDDRCAIHIFKEDGTEIGYVMIVRNQ